MKLQFYPAIKVHCWGGFGSQLNALALAQRLHELFENRKIILVIHEGGRHNAKFELEDIDLSDFNIELKSDFSGNNYVVKNNSKASINRIVKYFLRKLGFYNSCNSLKDIQKLRPWVLIVKGSYNLFPTETFLHFLNLQLKKIRVKDQFDIVIHYRLGDLLNLQEKDPIEASILIDLLISIERKYEINKIILLTSDPEIASSLFKKNNSQIAAKMFFSYAKPIEVLNYGISGKIFIGTNSKMSLWPVWLRTTNDSIDNYLPYVFQNDLSFIDQYNVKKFNVLFY
jgi:uncharacterized protein YlzI (FlbEa/FlbD family)